MGWSRIYMTPTIALHEQIDQSDSDQFFWLETSSRQGVNFKHGHLILQDDMFCHDRPG